MIDLVFQSLQSEWRAVFWITFVTAIAQLVVFGIWGSAKVQPWNDLNAVEPSNVPTVTTVPAVHIHTHAKDSYRRRSRDDAQFY